MQIIENATKKGYEKLKKEHISDYSKYFTRFSFDIGGKADNRTTPALLESYRSGKKEPYLEELFIQMGRYMMIATSRDGTLPSSVQGKWNAYKIPPWTCGYWYNINQQMNYWFVFALGLGDLYKAYDDFNSARYEKAKINGDAYIKNFYPERFEEGDGKNGWLVGTANSAYEVSGVGKNSHSGPGTSGFTVISDVDKVRYTHSENEARTVYKEVKEKIDLLDPVLVGASGQVKEFREENYYGDLGELEHRHVSQLVGLYPGSVINDETPAWLDAARVTLKNRGSRKGPGFGIMHRALLWARAKEGDMAYRLLNLEISTSIFDNLWGCHYDPMPVDRTDSHANFAIDANFGACAALSEMIVQSGDGTVKILPALPNAWKKGKVKHLAARDGFDISLSWKGGKAEKIEMISTLGGPLTIKYYNISKARFVTDNKVKALDKDTVLIETSKGDKIIVLDIPLFEITRDAHSLAAICSGGETILKWEKSPDENVTYKLYRAFDSSPTYTLLSKTDSLELEDKDRGDRQATYKVIALSGEKEESHGITVTVPSRK